MSYEVFDCQPCDAACCASTQTFSELGDLQCLGLLRTGQI